MQQQLQQDFDIFSPSACRRRLIIFLPSQIRIGKRKGKSSKTAKIATGRHKRNKSHAVIQKHGFRLASEIGHVQIFIKSFVTLQQSLFY